MKKLVFFVIAAVLVACGRPGEKSTGTGSIVLVLGDVKIEHDGELRKASAGNVFETGDSIITGKNSAAVASVNGGDAEFELQGSSVFTFSKVKEIEIVKGNIWLRVNRKLSPGEEYHMRTPVAVAAVRGTKMFAFQMEDISGMCHCEGSVDYSSEKTGYSHRHNRDHFTVTRGGVTALMTAEDIPFLLTPGDDHRHSVLENSPLGGKGLKMTPEIRKKFMKVVNEKLASAALKK